MQAETRATRTESQGIPEMLRVSRPRMICALALFIGITLWNLPTLWFPYGQDQALAHVVGRLILDGGVVYRDAIDDKPPGVFYLYALVNLLTGDGMGGARIADLVFLWATMFVMSLVGSRLGDPNGGIWGAFLFGLVYPLMGFWNMGLQEGFLLPFLWGSLQLALGGWERGGSGRWIFCGAAFGVVFWFKYPYALPLGVLAIALVWRGWRARKEAGSSPLSALALAGGFLVLVGLGALYLGHIGALQDMLEITLMKNIGERVQGSAVKTAAGVGWLRHWEWIATTPLFVAVVILAMVGYVLTLGRRRPGTWILGVYAVSMLVVIYLQMRFYQYHWIPLLSFLCLGAGFALSSVTRWAWRRRAVKGHWGGRCAIGILVALILALGFLSHGPFIKRWRLLLADRLSWEAYLATFPGSRDLPPYVLEDWEVSQAIREGAEEEETLFVWGSRPLIYYFSGRSPATSFLYVNHLYMPGARGEAMQNRLERELLAHPPGEILVYLPGDWTDALGDLQRLVPHVYDLITSHYWLAGKVGPFLIYERLRREARSSP